MMKFVTKYVLPLLALGSLVFGFAHVISSEQKLPQTLPPASPPRSPYGSSIGASGIIEPRSENIAIGTAIPGLVVKVYLPRTDIGIRVAEGQKLFRVDDRHLRAQLMLHKANLRAAEAQLAKLEQMPRTEELPPSEAKVRVADANMRLMLDQYERSKGLLHQKAITLEEHNHRLRTYEASVQQHAQARADFDLLKAGAWDADKAIARAAIAQAQAQVEQTETEIKRALVNAPMAANVLQLNVREGEYVATPAAQPLVVLGDLSKLHVRVDIDEHDIPRFRSESSATAHLRGFDRAPIQLKFVRTEPYVIPKRSLTGNNTERVDTRVLQVIYEVIGETKHLHVGQQLDVFIETAE